MSTDKSSPKQSRFKSIQTKLINLWNDCVSFLTNNRFYTFLAKLFAKKAPVKAKVSEATATPDQKQVATTPSTNAAGASTVKNKKEAEKELTKEPVNAEQSPQSKVVKSTPEATQPETAKEPTKSAKLTTEESAKPQTNPVMDSYLQEQHNICTQTLERAQAFIREYNQYVPVEFSTLIRSVEAHNVDDAFKLNELLNTADRIKTDFELPLTQADTLENEINSLALYTAYKTRVEITAQLDKIHEAFNNLRLSSQDLEKVKKGVKQLEAFKLSLHEYKRTLVDSDEATETMRNIASYPVTHEPALKNAIAEQLEEIKSVKLFATQLDRTGLVEELNAQAKALETYCVEWTPQIKAELDKVRSALLNAQACINKVSKSLNPPAQTVEKTTQNFASEAAKADLVDIDLDLFAQTSAQAESATKLKKR